MLYDAFVVRLASPTPASPVDVPLRLSPYAHIVIQSALTRKDAEKYTAIDEICNSR